MLLSPYTSGQRSVSTYEVRPNSITTGATAKPSAIVIQILLPKVGISQVVIAEPVSAGWTLSICVCRWDLSAAAGDADDPSAESSRMWPHWWQLPLMKMDIKKL